MENFHSIDAPSMALYDQLIGGVHRSDGLTHPILENHNPNPDLTIGPYQILGNLGYGSFSTVKLALYHNEKDHHREFVALKMVPLSNILASREDHNTPSRLCKNIFMEVWILSHLPSSDFFPSFRGLIFTNTHFIIVLEAITKGVELFSYLSDEGYIRNEEEARGVIGSISSAVNLLHSIGIIHRDLKLENIFLVPNSSTKKIDIKIVDFGLATWLPLENCTEIISFELRREWNEQLASFYELVSECGRIHSFLQAGDVLILLKNQSDVFKCCLSIPNDLKANVSTILAILTAPKPLGSIYQSNLSLYEKTTLTQRCGSEEYAPPELLLSSSPYSGQLAEAWSLGIIFYAIFTGKFPFQYTSASSYRLTLAKGIVEWSCEKFPSQDGKSLIEKLLTVSPKERISVHSLTYEPWLREFCQSPNETPLRSG